MSDSRGGRLRGAQGPLPTRAPKSPTCLVGAAGAWLIRVTYFQYCFQKKKVLISQKQSPPVVRAPSGWINASQKCLLQAAVQLRYPVPGPG